MSRGSLVNTSIGDYRLDRFIGAGGMGEVYRGIHARLGRAVAVKVLSPEGPGSSYVQRFWHEARLHATLHHPNIVELYDFIEHRGQLCIVMEYVDGETLGDRVRYRGPMPPTEALAVFRGVAAAAAYLHTQGIVHRDIKSANVRLVSTGRAKLLDFGIAKSGSTPALTNAGAVIGTLVYLAPEQLQGAPATSRSDVWALGLLLYEMLTGRLPFKGDTAGELLDTISRASFERASASAPARVSSGDPAWKACDRTVARCLRRDPADRYADAGELLRDLAASVPAEAAEPAFEAEPESDLSRPPTPSPLPRVLTYLERYWAWLAGAAALVLLVLVVVWWLPIGRSGPRDKPPDVSRSVHRIEVAGGAANVYVNGEFKGRTPFEYRATADETIHLVLRQDGFVPLEDKFNVTTRPVWTFVMRRAEGRQP